MDAAALSTGATGGAALDVVPAGVCLDKRWPQSADDAVGRECPYRGELTGEMPSCSIASDLDVTVRRRKFKAYSEFLRVPAGATALSLPMPSLSRSSTYLC